MLRKCILLFSIILLCACQPIDVAQTGQETATMPTAVGRGTADAPYTVWQVLDGTARTTDIYVAGYVVGYVTGTINKATFGAQGANTSNVMLAAAPDISAKDCVITVQLSNSTLSRGVSLAYNPDSLGRAVMLHTGVVAQYCYTTGLRDNDAYTWLGDAAWLDLDYGHPGDGTTTDEGGGNGDDGAGEDAGQDDDDPWWQPDDDEGNGNVMYLTGDEIWGCETEDVWGVAGFNDSHDGAEPDFPCTIDYIYTNELFEMFQKRPRWLVGYVQPFDDNHVEVFYKSALGITYAILLDLDSKDIEGGLEDKRQWMQRTLPGKDGRLLRICGRIGSYNKGTWHIDLVYNMDWLRKKIK